MPPKGAKRSAGKGEATPTTRGRKRSGGVTPEERDRINFTAREEMMERDAASQEKEREERKEVRTKNKGREVSKHNVFILFQ